MTDTQIPSPTLQPPQTPTTPPPPPLPPPVPPTPQPVSPTPAIPPSPTPVAPPPPVAPVPPIGGPNNNESLPPTASSQRLYIIAAIIVLFIAGGIFVFYKANIFRSSQGTGVAPTIAQKVLKSDLSKYDADVDQDGYPDFIEQEVGLDPKVSSFDGCQKGGCDEADLSSQQKKHNVLIILDASGSMATNGRMDVAKQAIRNYISQASGSTSIGLMQYGHRGSNSTSDKAASCVSADIVAPLGSINSSSIDGYLTTIKPVGWTPMGYALSQAASAFAGKEVDNNEIILLSDGEETCNSNPTGQASTLKSSRAAIKINVIGFAVDGNAQTQLNLISTSGGGTFATANSLTELDQKFKTLYENGYKLYQEGKCKIANVDEFRKCYNTDANKVIEWVRARKLLLYDKKITQEEYNYLDNLGTKLYKQQADVTSKATQDVNTNLNQKREELNK